MWTPGPTHRKSSSYGSLTPNAEEELSRFVNHESYLETLSDCFAQLAQEVHKFIDNIDETSKNYA